MAYTLNGFELSPCEGLGCAGLGCVPCGLGALSMDGSGLWGSGLFAGGLDVSTWGIGEGVAVLFGLYVFASVVSTTKRGARRVTSTVSSSYKGAKRGFAGEADAFSGGGSRRRRSY